MNDRRAVIGIHSAREVLKVRPHAVKEIWLKKDAERDLELKVFLDFSKKSHCPLRIQQESALNRIAASHQGVCLWVTETPKFKFEDLPDSESSTHALVLVLDEISDPHNVGALLRSSWLFGANAIIVPDRRAAHLTPAVTKVASGGAEHVPMHISNNLTEDLRDLKQKGFWVYGLDGGGRQTLAETRFHEKVALVVGAEDKGLRIATQKACDELIKIPQLDPAASLNASVAGAIGLYEVQRQWQNH